MITANIESAVIANDTFPADRHFVVEAVDYPAPGKRLLLVNYLTSEQASAIVQGGPATIYESTDRGVGSYEHRDLNEQAAARAIMSRIR